LQVVVVVGASVVVVADVGSLHPNQPGVLHVDVVVVVVVVSEVVVVSSRQPHQPGVLQVVVLVEVNVVVVDVVELVVVVLSDPLLLKNFHSSQS
jgi:hypothetical protein